MVNKKILDCEIEYSMCFSTITETQGLWRFRDDLLLDMYYHNFTLISKSNSDDELYRTIEDEIKIRRTENMGFCNIVSLVPVSDSLLRGFEITPQITVNGFYTFD